MSNEKKVTFNCPHCLKAMTVTIKARSEYEIAFCGSCNGEVIVHAIIGTRK